MIVNILFGHALEGRVLQWLGAFKAEALVSKHVVDPVVTCVIPNFWVTWAHTNMVQLSNVP